jgi:hypothetical protein
MGDSHVLHGVVTTTTDGADRETVATRAGTSGEVDVLFAPLALHSLRKQVIETKQTHLAGVDCNAVILVLDNRVLDGNARGLADIETVGIVAAIIVAVRIVNGNSINDKIVRLDTESLHGGVLDEEARDGRVV